MRALVTAAIAATLAGWAMGPPAASADDRQQILRERTCRFQWLDPGTWTAREERRTLACVVDRFGPVDGGIPKAEQVGACESGWNRLAVNGEYRGLFQHGATYWPSRVAWAMPDGWRVGPWASWKNSRAQIVVTIRMVHASGWGAWSCA